jgi:hypothetical protein
MTPHDTVVEKQNCVVERGIFWPVTYYLLPTTYYLLLGQTPLN